MPRVTVDATEYEKHELKTAPPDGFVMLRPLPYGMKLARRDKALKMRMISQTQQRGKRAPVNEEQVIDLEALNEWATMFDFQYCIGQHNLEDAAGNLLKFDDPRQIEMIFKSLDPKVGDEISDLINKLNEDESDETLADFTQPPGSSSEADSTTLETVS